MKIAVLVSAMAGTGHPLEKLEMDRNPGKHDPHPKNVYDIVPLFKQTAEKQILKMVNEKAYDIYMNLCEGYYGDEVPGVEVVNLLELLNAPYSGGRPDFYCMTKKAMKICANSCGVAIPNHVFVYSEADLDKLKSRNLNFPLIVKHHNGHDSIGLHADCKVSDLETLIKKTKMIMEKFGGALVEEFIDGPEYTVLVVTETEDFQPFAYNPVEMKFPENHDFKHFDLKWNVKDSESMEWKNVEDEKLSNDLKEAAKSIYTGCNGSGYARCDFRVDSKTGLIYFLEINCNCSVFYDDVSTYGGADHILSRETRGHPGFLRRILRNALKHRDMKMKKFKVDFTPQLGFHVTAGQKFETGDEVYSEENMPKCLVSRKFLDKASPVFKDYCNRYAYKMSETTYCTWSQDPEQWKPINHSCNPNLWIDGFAVVARRPILEGEQLTIDYATYGVNDGESKFECNCNSKTCRKTVDPNKDFLAPGFLATYGDHVTDFVKGLIEKHKVTVVNGH